MKSLALLFIFNLFLCKVQGQEAIDIPEFKNVNVNDKYPVRSVLASFTSNFDILISLKGYSAWGPDHSIKILAHHKSGWYKIEINQDKKAFDNYTICLSTYKLNDSIGNIVWDVLKQNHLFDMKDGRQIQASCAIPDTISHGIETIHMTGSDGSEYKFEIITRTNYKQVYFYSPQDLANVCPEPERKQIINCITAFENYLGK